MNRRLTLPISLACATVILVAACGSSATPAPTSAGATGSAGPGGAAASQAPVASGAPGGAASRAPGSSGSGSETGATTFGTAADNLDKLNSYKFSVSIKTVTASKASPAPSPETSTLTMSGTVINAPTKAYSLTMDDDGSTSGILVIGSDAWLQEDSGYQAVPAGMGDTFAQTMALYRPEKLFALTFGVNGSHFNRVGEENKNGVATIHYKGDESLNSIYGAMFGLSASFTSDVWIAKDGGYIVSSEVKTSGSDATSSGSYSSVVNITDINASSNKLDKPS